MEMSKSYEDNNIRTNSDDLTYSEEEILNRKRTNVINTNSYNKNKSKIEEKSIIRIYSNSSIRIN